MKITISINRLFHTAEMIYINLRVNFAAGLSPLEN
jgi:hypothetical protein